MKHHQDLIEAQQEAERLDVVIQRVNGFAIYLVRRNGNLISFGGNHEAAFAFAKRTACEKVGIK